MLLDSVHDSVEQSKALAHRPRLMFMVSSELPDVASAQITAILLEKASRTPAQQKMDSQLLQAVERVQGIVIIVLTSFTLLQYVK